jgi:hypothetical protein
MVSSPKWHWRWRRLFPATSPRNLQLRLVQAVHAHHEALEVVLLRLRVDLHKLVPSCLVGLVVSREGYPALTRVYIEKHCACEATNGSFLWYIESD